VFVGRTARKIKLFAPSSSKTTISSQYQGESASRDQRPTVSPRELAGPVRYRRRHRKYWFVLQIPPNVRREIGGRTVTARAILFESLQCNRVQIAAQLLGERCRFGLALAGDIS